MRFFTTDKVTTVVRNTAGIGKYSLFFRIFNCGAVALATRFFGKNGWTSGHRENTMQLPPPKKLAIIGGSMFAFSIGFFFISFPPILKSQVKSQVALKKKSDMRELWSNLPQAFEFKVYLFNVSNPKEISKGEKPIVNEVGPFVYDRWTVKVDLEDREEDDTVEYSQRTTWIFNAEKSNPLTGNEILTLPHLLILGIITTAARERPNMMGLVGKGIDSIFKKPENIFVQVTPHDVLFGGLPIDCTVKDFGGAAVCSVLKETPDLERDGEDRYRISIFGHKNGTVDNNRIRVKRGKKNYMQLGEVVEYKGEPQQTVWPEGSRCNTFNGTDGTIFHPYLYETEDVVSFSPDICRSISLHFDGNHGKIGGMHTNHYVADLGDMSTDPELSCFCEAEDKCLKKGLYDMYKCLGVPLIATLPHFYLVDEEYLTQVDGLHPDKEKHQIDVDFQPMTGSPLSARKRLQFNVFLFPIDKVRTMKNFATALFPIFWIEDGITLEKKLLNEVKFVFKVLKAVAGVKWTMMIIGMGLGGAGARMEYVRRQAEANGNVTKVTPQAGSRTESGTEKTWPLNVQTLQAAQVPPNLDAN